MPIEAVSTRRDLSRSTNNVSTDTIDSFEDDLLGRHPFAKSLERFLLVENDYVDGALVVDLNARFGAGKTTFIRMWKADLHSRRAISPQTPLPVVLNAWESDYCGDPLLSIITGILSAIDESEPDADTDQKKQKLREAARVVAWFTTGIASQVVSHFTGIDPVAAGETAQKKGQGEDPKKPDFVRIYEHRRNALEMLKEALRDLFSGDDVKALIFVDELDRCRPDYAISYLEAIKHIFDIKGLVFVLAVNADQLETSAKSLFGSDLVFDDYYRRFVHRRFELPSPQDSFLANLAEDYTRRYLHIEGKRSCGIRVDESRIKKIVKLVTGFQLNPRQLQEVFRTIGHTAARSDLESDDLPWCFGMSLILLATLKVATPRVYNEFGSGRMQPQEFAKYLLENIHSREAGWWFSIYITCIQHDAAKEDVDRLFVKIGIPTREDYSQFHEGWGSCQGTEYRQIFDTIESAEILA